MGRDAEDFRVDSFTVSYGDPQTVAVWAKRALTAKKMVYSINGGKPVKTDVTEWAGGERYGFENVDYYAEYRGVVTGASPGDSVEVWFTGTATGKDLPKGQKAGPVSSEHFTYEVAQDTGNSVLIVANEDYTGVNPTYPAGTTAPKYVDEHVNALLANGVTPDVWDVDAQGVPHDLGVLGHYDAVLWYLGDNRLTQDPEDELTQYGSAQLPDLAVAERQQYLTIAMRDYLNQGGKVAYAGETAGYYGIGASQFGGIYYGLNGHPEQECAVTTDPRGDCLLLADDFTQYWMGAYDRTALTAEGVKGTAEPLDGFEALFGGPATVDNPIDEVGAFTPTSERLPVADFPQFESWRAADYTDVSGRIVAVEGELAAAATHVDDGYQRLGRTFDLTGVSAADAPTFEAQIAYDTEEGYDNVIVEVHTVGSDDWTTLPDLNGGTSTAVPTECEAGFYMGLHPQLQHYLTLGDPCLPTGTTGDVERLHGLVEWLGSRGVRSQRLRRQHGRGGRELRHRSEHRRGGPHRRRHQARRRGIAHPGRWLRSGLRRLVGARPARGKRRQPERLRDRGRTRRGRGGHGDTRHAALRLRPRAARVGCGTCRRGGADARPLRGVALEPPAASDEAGGCRRPGSLRHPPRNNPVRSSRPRIAPLDLIAPSVRHPPVPTCELFQV